MSSAPAPAVSSSAAGSGDRVSRIAANVQLLDVAAKSTAVLRAAGIESVVLKGAALLGSAFDLHERKLTDVDLLVSPRSYRAARWALQSAGYVGIETPDRPLSAARAEDGALSDERGFLVDLHGRLAQPTRWPADIDGIVARGVPHDGGRLRRADAADLLLCCAINAAKDEYAIDGRPGRDALRIVERLDPNWDHVVERARAWSVRVATWVLLEHARRTRGLDAPAEVLAALRPSAARRRWLSRWLDLDAERPYRDPTHSRRRRQLLVGPAISDRQWRFAADALSFAGWRAADFVVAEARDRRRR